MVAISTVTQGIVGMARFNEGQRGSLFVFFLNLTRGEREHEDVRMALVISLSIFYILF